MEHFNAAEAASALKYIFRSGDVFEIRALDAQTTSYVRTQFPDILITSTLTKL